MALWWAQSVAALKADKRGAEMVVSMVELMGMMWAGEMVCLQEDLKVHEKELKSVVRMEIQMGAQMELKQVLQMDK